jgi:F-type H+-transporting ATPase subunit b
MRFAADTTTHSWILPEGYELLWGGIASVLVFALLFWKVGPIVVKALRARTERIQGELDDSVQRLATAQADAARVRQALGDIEAERRRALAEADEQAGALIAAGRERLELEVAELEAKADADIASAASRAGDELRSEVGHLAADAAERVIASSLDDATLQRLIEDYIQKVGAAT